jgi:hypothetical protein
MTDPTPNRPAESTFRLMYRSRNLVQHDQRKLELGQLFSEARSNNKRQGITGALLLSEDWFVQVLEGEEDAVRALFSHIERDARHDSVTVLETGRAPARLFARWAMAKVAEHGEPDIPLIAHTDGIAPAAGRGTTPAQDHLLDVMRSAALAAGPVASG